MAEQEGAISGMVVKPLTKFYKDSYNLVNKCTKPDGKEFMRIATATGVGLLILGGIGFMVKLIHLPVNQILLGSA
eukprot:CAMPEP_0197442460 /NCGR_PEP_ID=MMETSP1175-20131217/8473_1 /TAXON_ID=1003142 /ORGANISM="Triceratium dubium, Strain CCMP147" /LENGTH=74 /DNA_ID=CAMNT_0042972939 /DNA_START=83 /DNA_END=307 /DNA_ORIENTATION=+